MQQFEKNFFPDLIVDTCPFGCDTKCDKQWVNELTGHQIVCVCTCYQHKKKGGALGMVGEPGSSAIRNVEPSSYPEESSKDEY